jgi:hypothetical protein
MAYGISFASQIHAFCLLFLSIRINWILSQTPLLHFIKVSPLVQILKGKHTRARGEFVGTLTSAVEKIWANNWAPFVCTDCLVSLFLLLNILCNEMLQTDVELCDRKYISSYLWKNIFYPFTRNYCRRNVILLTKRIAWILQYIELHFFHIYTVHIDTIRVLFTNRCIIELS